MPRERGAAGIERLTAALLLGFVASLQVSIALANILLTATMLCWAATLVRDRTWPEAPRFFLPLAIYGAARIGKPRSPWARHRYGDGRPKKQTKAEERFKPDRHTERFKNAARDIIGGKPSEGVAAVKDEVLATGREAAEEFRDAAKGIGRPSQGEDRDGG